MLSFLLVCHAERFVMAKGCTDILVSPPCAAENESISKLVRYPPRDPCCNPPNDPRCLVSAQSAAA